MPRSGIGATLAAICLTCLTAASEDLPVWPPPAWECPPGASLKRSEDHESRVQSCVLGDQRLHGLTRIWDGLARPVRELEYRNDVEHGPVREWYVNGKPALDGHFTRGEPSGVWTRWRPNGSLESRVHWSGGEFEGPATWWYASGARRLEGRNRRGRKDGLWTRWREDGTKQSTCHWENGRQVGACVEWP